VVRLLFLHGVCLHQTAIEQKIAAVSIICNIFSGHVRPYLPLQTGICTQPITHKET